MTRFKLTEVRSGETNTGETLKTYPLVLGRWADTVQGTICESCGALSAASGQWCEKLIRITYSK